MKSDSTTVIKNMEFLVKELHKEWDRSGASKASVIISLEEVDGINDKLKEIIYQTQKSVDEDELTFKQSIAKSKECYADQFIIYCICSYTYHNHLAVIRIQNMIRITQQGGRNIVFLCYCLDNAHYRTRICIYKYLHFLLKSISYQL